MGNFGTKFRFKLGIAFIGTALLIGCATTTPWSMLDGQKNEGRIDLYYNYSELGEAPMTSAYQAQTLAEQKCQNWQYGGAEAFGEADKTCKEENDDGICLKMQVVQKYQCTN